MAAVLMALKILMAVKGLKATNKFQIMNNLKPKQKTDSY